MEANAQNGAGTPFFSTQDILTERELVANYVRHVVARFGGNKTQAARVLGIDRRSLYRRLGGK